MANRVSSEQLEALLEFLAQHPALAKGIGLGARSRETVDRQWNDLDLRLNAFGSGSTKTGERWKKYWADLKFKTKSRLSRRRQDALATGGGPSTQEDLSETDLKILNILGEQAVYGDTEHRVPVFNVQPEVAGSPPVQPEHIVAEEVVISDTSEPVPVASPEEAQVLERHQAGVEAPEDQPARRLPDRPRRQNRPSGSIANRLQSRVDPEWVMDLESNRVQNEGKLADAVHIIAQASNKIAEASLQNAETSRMQVQVLSTLVDIVRQLSGGQPARPHEN